MDDLVAFLRARLDEDEREIRSILQPAEPSAALPTSHQAMHMVVRESEPRWPGGTYRMLADIEAKRRIIKDHEQGPKTRHHPEPVICYRCGDPPGYDYEWMLSPCPTLRLLALPYAEHDDYQQAWTPGPEFGPRQSVVIDTDGAW